MKTKHSHSYDSKEILTKAIKQSIAGGWDMPTPHFISEKGAGFPIDDSAFGAWTTVLSTNDIIFNHDFAKALWGEEVEEVREAKVIYAPYADGNKQFSSPPILVWCFHLQQMVIANDPIAYLGSNI